MATTKNKSKTSAWSKLTPDQALVRLAELETVRIAASHDVDQLVLILRTPNLDGFCPCSWAEVGKALGISKQAAQQRYVRRDAGSWK